MTSPVEHQPHDNSSEEPRFSREDIARLAAYPHPQALLLARLRRLPVHRGELNQLWAQFCFMLPASQSDTQEFTESRLLHAWDQYIRQERCFREGLYQNNRNRRS